MRTGAAASFLVCLGLLLPLAPDASAQEAEATPGAGSAMAGRTACLAEPRDVDELLALWFTPEGTPLATPAAPESVADDAALPEGTRVDADMEAAIAETTLDWIYCSEVALQYARGFSHLTDDLAARFGPDPTQDSPDEVRAALEGQLLGTPIPGDEAALRLPAIAGPRKVRSLDDGRVAAIWSFGGDRVFLIYEQQDEDGRWLIDEAIDILDAEGTPTP